MASNEKMIVVITIGFNLISPVSNSFSKFTRNNAKIGKNGNNIFSRT